VSEDVLGPVVLDSTHDVACGRQHAILDLLPLGSGLGKTQKE
jgi:hypothetical protein